MTSQTTVADPLTTLSTDTGTVAVAGGLAAGTTAVNGPNSLVVSAAAGVTAAPVTAAVETDVSVKTPSGTCDAALVHPQSGRWAIPRRWSCR